MPLPSCGIAAPELGKGGYRLLNETGTVEIPFELMDEHVVIPVSFNGSEPFRLGLDTGMPFYGATLDPSPITTATIMARVSRRVGIPRWSASLRASS